MEAVGTWFGKVRDALQITIIKFGETTITLWTIVYLVVLIALLVWGSGLFRRGIVRALRGSGVDAAVGNAIGTIARYSVVIIGLLLVVQTAGINLTTLNVLAGALGIGIGLGLQSIASNFISGIILLVGRPIKVGDRIEVEDVLGDVTEIGARATTILTNDNIAIIVPNSVLVTETVVNWSHNDRIVRFKIPVQVAYGTDLRRAEAALKKVAADDPDVLDDPAPTVRFVAFGDSGVNLELLAWTQTLVDRKGLLVSRINFAIYDAFTAETIEVPFPQRVVHLRQAPPPKE